MKELFSERVFWAAQVLELGNRADIEEIKDAYKRLVKKWHPDNCKDELSKCQKKIQEVIEAYNIILDYCNEYRFSFIREDIVESISFDKQLKEKMIERFGDTIL